MEDEGGGVQFAVSSVELGKPINSAPLDVVKALTGFAGATSVEFVSPLPSNSVYLFEKNNLLAKAVHNAFYSHYPLTLSPDVIWTTIAQGLAYHINENAETLRSKFVDFSGQKDIVVTRPDFVKGSDRNNWAEVIPEFCSKIGDHIGHDTNALIENNFSTTTPLSKLCSQVTLLDAVKSYFKLIIVCGCGIPSIKLLGKPEDWISIRERAAKLAEYDLSWWINELVPVLDQFVDASQGKVDQKFWQSVCNVMGGSGYTSPINGWIQCFFPYVMTGGEPRGGRRRRTEGPTPELRRNNYLGAWKISYKSDEIDMSTGLRAGSDTRGTGIKLEVIPSGLSSAPFVYLDVSTGKSHNMKFVGGLFSITQDPTTLALEPQFGFAIIEA